MEMKRLTRKKCLYCRVWFRCFPLKKLCSDKCWKERKKGLKVKYQKRWKSKVRLKELPAKKYWSKNANPIHNCPYCGKEFKKLANWKTCSRICSSLNLVKCRKQWNDEWRRNNLKYFAEYQRKWLRGLTKTDY
jgi:hypothetical protein